MDESKLSNVATRLAVLNHRGWDQHGTEASDGAVSGLYLSKTQPGEFFVLRANRPGYTAEPTKLGKGRRAKKTGAYGVSPKQAVRFLKRAAGARHVKRAVDHLAALRDAQRQAHDQLSRLLGKRGRNAR